MLRVVDRNLRDADVPGISDDLRFQQAYEAVLILGTVVLNAAGYRTHGGGHHWVTFESLREILDTGSHEMLDYFQNCRTKRNVLAYDRAGETSATDARELLSEARRFSETVMAWLKTRHPQLTGS